VAALAHALDLSLDSLVAARAEDAEDAEGGDESMSA